MITITRMLARQIRAVFSRCLHPSTRGPFPPVVFEAGAGGLTIRAQSHDAAIAFHRPGTHPDEQLAIPFDVLKQCEGTRRDDVTLERRGDNVIVAWTDNGIPQTIQVELPEDGDDFPEFPTVMQPNDARLLAALHNAAATTDNSASRYAVGCLQLQGERGMVAATDGQQLLSQLGFEFPWEDALLVPARKVFGSRELSSDVPVEVGQTDDWVCFRSGDWTIQLKIETEARFPPVEDHIPAAGSATTTLLVSDGDAEFLTKSVRSLPGGKGHNAPVTLDLNGEAVVRAINDEQSSPTELVLRNSNRTGDVLRLNSNRRYLARAMKLGFREVELYGEEAPACCRDESRTYLWAVLSKGDAIPPDPKATRIESPVDASSPPLPERQSRRKTNMPRSPSTNGASRQNGHSAPEANGADSLIEQADRLKGSLQESLSQTRELIIALKRQKKQSKLMKTTLASLRQLQTVEV